MFVAAAFREAGDAAYRLGDVMAAHRHWSAAIKSDPADARAYSNRSMVRLAHCSDVTGALEDAEAAVAADRSFARGYVRLEAAMRCARGDGEWSGLKEAFLGEEFDFLGLQKDSDDDDLSPEEKAEKERATEINLGFQAIIDAIDKDGASEVEVADAKLLKVMLPQVFARFKHHSSGKLPAVASWIERISRRIETKLTDESN